MSTTKPSESKKTPDSKFMKVVDYFLGTPKRKPKPVSDEEDARITAAAESDPDNPIWTEEDFAKARPAKEVVPHIVERHRKVRGNKKK